MPELPEVETIKNALKPLLEGRCFKRIDKFIAAIRYPLGWTDKPELLDSPITCVRRRARYLVIEMANLNCLIFHFGMSGSVRIVPEDEPRLKHEHLVFLLCNGSTLRFNCPRRFGFVQTCILDNPGAEPSILPPLGPEPLSDDFSGEYLKKILQGRAAKLKNTIMDNRIVVGVGNIYVTEAMFAARVRPTRKASSLTRNECERLVEEIKKVLIRSIHAGGTTISDYKSVDGSEGKFVQQLQMYGRKGEDCPTCGTSVSHEVIGGRSSFYCQKCQK
jgi:formamidopyrimidine-DNA glycosylase